MPNDTFEPLRYSKYDISLIHWLKVFPLKQIHIIDADAVLRDNPATELARIEHYLGLSQRFHPDQFVLSQTKGFYCVAGRPCLSAEKGHHYAQLSAYISKKLVKYFKPHVQNLWNQTGKRLSWMDRYLE